MSTLLIDIGNTRIKWALWKDGRLGRQQAAAHEGWSSEDFQRVVFDGLRKRDSRAATRGTARAREMRRKALSLRYRVIVVSVAGTRIDRQLVRAARAAWGVKPTFVQSRRKLAGVTTRYREPWRLGADRLVAAVGGHSMSPDRAVCVVDIGTAMTIDLVDSRGVHLGGAIVPGPRLMVGSLLKDTSGIQRRAGGQALGRSLFARNTRAAIEQGVRHALASIIDRAAAEARIALGRVPLVLLTGGAVSEIAPLVRSRFRTVPDLVLRGLARLA